MAVFIYIFQLLIIVCNKLTKMASTNVTNQENRVFNIVIKNLKKEIFNIAIFLYLLYYVFIK